MSFFQLSPSVEFIADNTALGHKNLCGFKKLETITVASSKKHRSF